MVLNTMRVRQTDPCAG